MYRRRKRKPYGLRKGYLKDLFTNIAAGDVRIFPLDEVNVSSCRSRATELNMAAGYTKYSVSVDRMLQTLRVLNNG